MPPQHGVCTVVFIGSRGVVTTPARGHFHCPSCDAARSYAVRRVRKMLVVLRIPIAHRGDERSVVQCGFCRAAFHPSVLEADPPLPSRGPTGDPTPDWHFAELTGAAATTLLTWEDDER